MVEKIIDEFVKKSWEREYEKEKEEEKQAYLNGAVKSIKNILKKGISSYGTIYEINQVMEELKNEIGEI